jgi:ketosteroid isomerase-like protein
VLGLAHPKPILIKLERGAMKKQRTNFMAGILLPLILCGVIMFWALQVSTEEFTKPQKEVWKKVESKWKAMKAGDSDALSFEGNFEWSPKMLQPRGGDALKANYENWFNDDKPVSYELKPVKIHISGNVAIAFYFWRWKGNILSDSGKQMSTFILQDNEWKQIGGMASSCGDPLKCH